MPATLVDWAMQERAEFIDRRAALPWWKRTLCRYGMHGRWCRLAHESELARITRRFTESWPELSLVPMKKMDGSVYRFRIEETLPECPKGLRD